MKQDLIKLGDRLKSAIEEQDAVPVISIVVAGIGFACIIIISCIAFA